MVRPETIRIRSQLGHFVSNNISYIGVKQLTEISLSKLRRLSLSKAMIINNIGDNKICSLEQSGSAN